MVEGGVMRYHHRCRQDRLRGDEGAPIGCWVDDIVFSLLVGSPLPRRRKAGTLRVWVSLGPTNPARGDRPQEFTVQDLIS